MDWTFLAVAPLERTSANISSAVREHRYTHRVHACTHVHIRGLYLLLSRRTYKSAGRLSEYFPSNLISRGRNVRYMCVIPHTFPGKDMYHAHSYNDARWLFEESIRGIRIFRGTSRIVTEFFFDSLYYAPSYKYLVCSATTKFLYKIKARNVENRKNDFVEVSKSLGGIRSENNLQK